MDGCIYNYGIDNSIAECISPLAGECKNSSFFVGNHIFNLSAPYHTLLSIYHMNGLSVLEYLKNFYRKFMNGHSDYENLFSMKIESVLIKIKNYAQISKYLIRGHWKNFFS